jgi:sugar diacid utilization regulator
VIYDGACANVLELDSLLLAVGIEIEDLAAVRLLSEAGAVGAGAVVYRLTQSAPARLLAASQASGVAALGVSSSLAWGEAHLLFHAAIAVAGPSAEPASKAVPRGDLFGLVNAIAATVGGAATLYDSHDRLLAYSTLDDPIDEPRRQAILLRHSPAGYLKRLRDDGHLGRVFRNTGVVRIEYPDFRTRLNIAVCAGREVIGQISVVEGRTPLGPEAEAALVEMAKLAAPQLVHQLASRDVERRHRGVVLHAILNGSGDLPSLGARVGIDPSDSIAVVAFTCPKNEDSGTTLRRVMELVTFRSESLGVPAVCGTFSGLVYLIVARPEELGEARLDRLVSEIVQIAERTLKVMIHAGIGSTMETLAEAPQSRWEAETVARVARETRRVSRVAHVNDVRAKVVIAELRALAADRPQLKRGKLQILCDHDAEHQTAYIETLKAYFDAFGEIRKAAAAVSVHPNTFRYRIRRIEEVAGLQLDDPEERLIAELQLRFLAP